MVWSWSHSQEAYANAEENLRNLPKETLEIIFAEWRAAQGKHGAIDPICPGFSERKYQRGLKDAKTLPQDTLVEFIWEKASEFATCGNGGSEAWMCPHGCVAHWVSFSPPLEEDESETPT